MRKIAFAVLVSIFHSAICILSGAIGWYNQFIIVSIMSCIAVYLSWRVIKLNIKQVLIPIAPFYLLIIIASIKLQSYQVFPIWIVGIITSLISLYLFKSKLPRLYSFILLAFIILFGRFVIMPNNFAYLYQYDTSTFHFENLVILDTNKNVIPLSKYKGKITVFDMWNTNCGVCIRQFPEIEELHKKYESDTSIIISTLYYPHSHEEEDPMPYVRKYHFTIASIVNRSEARKVNVEAFPNVVILDQNLKCVYVGQLNTGFNVFIGNVHRIIRK